MRISVVIPHLNQPEMLARCLSSLFEGRRLPDEIFVVDNGSKEFPTAICATRPGVTLLSEETPGPGPARNRGVAASTGDILAFIDADCFADPDWLSAAESVMADSTAEILGGDVRIPVLDPDRLTQLEAYESEYAYRMDRYIAREGFTGTGNLVVRRRVLEDVGHFAGLSVAEDRDWGQRATTRGYSIRYVAEMRVYHPARKSFAEIFRKWERHTAHDFVRARTKTGGQILWALKTGAMAISPIAEIPRILGSSRIQGLRSRAAAFVALCRIRLYRAKLMVWLMVAGDPAALSDSWNRNQ